MFGDDGRQGERFGRVAGGKGVLSAERFKMVSALIGSGSASANAVLEGLEEQAGGNDAGGESVQRDGFRSRVLEDFPARVKDGEHRRGILGAEWLDCVEYFVHRAIAV